eukprot:gene25841-32338_t
MVEDFGHSGASLGYYAGGLAGAFCAAQFCSSILWGWFSDKYGRKPAVFLGTLGTALGMIVFGTSRTYTQAVIGRVISGFLCGNLGVVKSFLTEVTDDTNRGKAFSLFSLGWAIGTVIAPIAGGFLCKPADKYPAYFSQSGLFGYYPYLLPCLLCFCFNMAAALICLFAMVETRVFKKPHSGLETEEDEEEDEEVQERPNLPERLARMETTTDDEASVDSSSPSPLHHIFREKLGVKDHSFASIVTDSDMSSLDDFDLESGLDVLVSVAKSVMGCISFTAVMLQVNHSVYDEHLGAVNGLGQSLASLSRAVGPAIGVLYINSILPPSLDIKKKARA